MKAGPALADCRRLLVVVPNWVGDLVMATPVLAALRAQLPAARITLLMRRHLAEVVAGGGWHDDELHWSQLRGLARERGNFDLARRIRAEAFDAALLLTNSFRSAAVVWLARVPRRIGYARDARTAMLTHRIRPRRADGRFTPYPMIDSYAELVESVGITVDDRRTRLAVTDEQDRAAEELRAAHGLSSSERYAVIAPGAAFGAAKCWLPERFAAVCDRLRADFGLRCLLVGSDKEAEILDAIADAANSDVVRCLNPGTTLGSLKAIIRDAAVLTGNDSGPRHYGLGLGVPTVTVFGPTDPRWTDGDFLRERIVRIDVECGPCQLRTCPIDHRCMTGVSVEMVVAAAADLLRAGGASGAGHTLRLTATT